MGSLNSVLIVAGRLSAVHWTFSLFSYGAARVQVFGE